MAKSIIGSLRVSLGLDSAAFQTGLSKAEGRMAGFSKRMRQIGSQIGIVGAAVSAVGAGIAYAIKGQIDAADSLSKAAQKFGVPVESLSRLKHAADLSDVSLEVLGVGLSQLSKKMISAADGNKAAATTFRNLGVSITDASGKIRPTEQVLSDISTAIAAMPDGAEKTAAAMSVFGRSGAELIPLLNGGGAAIREMMKEAEDLGLVIDEKTGKAAENFNDNLTRMGAVVRGLTIQIMAALAPMLDVISGKVFALSKWFSSLSPRMREMAAVAATIVVALGPLLVGLGIAVTSIGALTAAFGTLAAALWANPILAIIGAIAAGAFLVYYNWETVSAFMIDMFRRISAGLEFIAETGNAAAYHLKAAFIGAVNSIIGAFVDMTWTVANGFNALFQTDTFSGMSATVTQELAVMQMAALDAAGAAQSAADAAASVFSAPAAAIADTAEQVKAAGAQITETLEGAAAAAGDLGEQLGGSGGGGGKGGAKAKKKKSVKDGVDSAKQALDQFRGAASNAFSDLITGAISFNEALGRVLGSISEMLAQDFFTSLFGGSDSGSGIIGKLFGFANGTNSAPGGLAMVGERGPELVNLPRGAQVFSAAETREMVGDGGRGGVWIDIDARGAQAGVAEQIDMRLRQAIPTIVEMSKRAVADGRRRGEAL